MQVRAAEVVTCRKGFRNGGCILGCWCPLLTVLFQTDGATVIILRFVDCKCACLIDGEVGISMLDRVT